MMPVETAWCYRVLSFSEGSIYGGCNTVSCVIATFPFTPREQEKPQILKQHSQALLHVAQYKDLDLYE